MTPAEALPWGIAGLSAVAAAAYAFAYSRACRRAAQLEVESARLREEPKTNEYRLERFDLVWYPAVTYAERDKLVVKAASGVPHCKACVAPLSSSGKGWKCPGCQTMRPETIADTAATDSVMKEALRFFLQRRADYRVAPELERFK
ncbi:MAG: hypothetical protein HY553_22100 [Elusimicrobia bacterium]|nr:hypothetical protein [Elusimicrobiota bacterium]